MKLKNVIPSKQKNNKQLSPIIKSRREFLKSSYQAYKDYFFYWSWRGSTTTMSHILETALS